MIGASVLNQTFVFVPVTLFMILGNLNSRSLVTGSVPEGKGAWIAARELAVQHFGHRKLREVHPDTFC